MKKLLVLLTILSSIASFAEDTIELNQTTVKGSPRNADYSLIPKEQKNTFVITQERIREKNYKNVEDILRDAPGVIVQNTAFGPRIDMRGSGECTNSCYPGGNHTKDTTKTWRGGNFLW